MTKPTDARGHVPVDANRLYAIVRNYPQLVPRLPYSTIAEPRWHRDFAKRILPLLLEDPRRFRNVYRISLTVGPDLLAAVMVESIAADAHGLRARISQWLGDRKIALSRTRLLALAQLSPAVPLGDDGASPPTGLAHKDRLDRGEPGPSPNSTNANWIDEREPPQALLFKLATSGEFQAIRQMLEALSRARRAVHPTFYTHLALAGIVGGDGESTRLGLAHPSQRHSRGQRIFLLKFGDWLREGARGGDVHNVENALLLASACGVKLSARHWAELVLAQRSRPENAEATLHRLIDDGCPVSDYTWSVVIEAFANAHNADDATRVYHEAIAAGRSASTRARHALARERLRRGETPEALALLNSADVTAERAGASDAWTNGLRELARLTVPEPLLAYYDWGVGVGLLVNPDAARSYARVCARAGRTRDAERVMKSAGALLDIAAWGELLDGYRRERQVAEVERIFAEMEAAGLAPDLSAWTSRISAQSAAGEFQAAERLFELMQARGIQPDVVAWGSLIAAATRVGRPQDTVRLFDRMRDTGVAPNLIIWTTLIQAYSRSGWAEDAERVFREMQRSGSVPDLTTWNALLVGYASTRQPGDVERLLEEMRTAGLRPDANGWVGIAVAYARGGLVDDLDNILETIVGGESDALEPQDLVRVASAYAAAGRKEQADRWLAEVEGLAGGRLVDVAPAAWLSLLVAFGDQDAERVSRVEALMRAAGIELDAATRGQLVIALIRAGRTDAADAELQLLTASGGDVTASVWAAVTNAWAMNGEAEKAEETLRAALRATVLPPQQQVVLYNITLRAYSIRGQLDAVERLSSEMVALALPMDRYTIGSIANTRDRAGAMESAASDTVGSSAMDWRELAVLLRDVVHELSQPVGRLRLRAIALTQAALRQDNAQCIREAETIASDAEVIATRLDAYSALTETSVRGSRPVRIESVLEQVRDILAERARRAGITIDVHARGQAHWGGVPAVAMDPFVLRIAIKALLQNAIEALESSPLAHSDRRVWMFAHFQRRRANQTGHGWVEVCVRDNGAGVPGEIRERIFERGFSTKRARGLGLGLGIVQSIASAHGGVLKLADVEPGAEFWLRLPAAAWEEPPS